MLIGNKRLRDDFSVIFIYNFVMNMLLWSGGKEIDTI